MIPGEKALRFLRDGKVRALPTARVFAVDGDHDSYLVLLAGMRTWCECPARVAECAHVQAARLQRDRDDEREVAA